MKIFQKIADVQAFIGRKKEEGLSIGFVPTMGALHEGHLTLLSECKRECDLAVVSIFVNPTQFNNKKDLEKYPRTIATDIQVLTDRGCDVLFHPEVSEMYPSEEITRFYDLGMLEKVFEGVSRPGHFQGVCQVVDKLFTVIKPHEAFFGQKDYQQCMVIKKLADLTPAFASIHINIVPTVRAENGLAMSSRNMLLPDAEKENAAIIYRSLLTIKEKLRPGPVNLLAEEAVRLLELKGLKTDYVGIADAHTLQPVEEWDGKKPLVALIAAFTGNVRLIDNLIIA
ncbi:pantoate--beta-alanine ligase [Niabella aquatica]